MSDYAFVGEHGGPARGSFSSATPCRYRGFERIVFPREQVEAWTVQPRGPASVLLLWALWSDPTAGSVGLGQANLYPMGTDESSVGSMFTDPSSGLLSIPFDGVLVFVVKYWFSFDTSIDDRWEVMTDFALQFQERADLPHFYVDTPAAPNMKKVAILLQPRFEYGPSPETNFAGKIAKKADADIEVIVRGNGGRGHSAEHGTEQAKVRIRDSTMGRWLMRFALDPSHWGTRNNNRRFRADDLQPLATWLATELGHPLGSIRSYE